MNHYAATHPQAIRAIWLAQRLQEAAPDVITRALALSEVPRRLFVLAATLQAQQGKTGQIINVKA